MHEQISSLLRFFPHIDATETHRFVAERLPNISLPGGAEGWFAIPRWQKFAENYAVAAEVVHAKWRKTPFWQEFWVSSFCEKGMECITSGTRLPGAGSIKPDRIRQHSASTHMLAEIEKVQSGEILLIPAQHGLRHLGRSVIEARHSFAPNEFGLGVFAGLCMALTHPERYSQTLGAFFPGDESEGRYEWSKYKPGDFGFVPKVSEWNEKIAFVMSESSIGCSGNVGSVTGFVPNV